ncbi:unnamed protein product [Oppiella nova]|uniref:Uncharacterized protein n=1 Tax=Oppiella nova TaxID=334625 RepID=A0A7R9QBE5_9ACAR|nr:unnamed protein product [Oppiella nova]CAG2161502.1 unnamed protein product [Oppiella nova]
MMFDWESGDGHTHPDDTDKDFDPIHPVLCHPELMSRKQLHDLLQKRHWSLPEELAVNGYEYYNLIDLYNRVLLPLPQRRYGDNRQSTHLKAKQLDCNQSFALKRKSDELTASADNSSAKKVKTISSDCCDNYETNGKRNATHVSQQTIDNKRHKISWP